MNDYHGIRARSGIETEASTVTYCNHRIEAIVDYENNF